MVELTPVVTLDGLNGEAELSGHPDKEVEEGGRSQTWRAKEKSKCNERNHQPSPDSIYNQKGWEQEKSTGHSEQDQRHVSHAKEKKKEV